MPLRKSDGFKNQRHITFPIKNFPAYLTDPMVKGSYVTEIGYYPEASAHFRQRLDGADEGILFCCLEGSGTIQLFTNGKWDNHYIGPGDIFFIPPKIPHVYFSHKETPWSILWLHFQSPLTKRLVQLPLKNTMADSQKRLLVETALMDFFAMGEKNLTLNNTIYMASLLEHLLITAYFYEDTPEACKKNHLLTACIQYMEQQLGHELTLQELTERFNVSSSYLHQIFKQETSQAPMAFFIKLKMDEACKLLRITPMKVNEISHKLGYQDAYYFSRLFKKVIGTSPKAYRERYRLPETDFLDK